MRPQQEIIARIEARKPEDPLMWEYPYYISSLTFENAKRFLSDDKLVPEDWGLMTSDDIRKTCIDYMPFAWEKANGCRGLSAERSIHHYIAWLWLLEVEWADRLWDGYRFYGKPQLIRICEYLGLDPTTWDDGNRIDGWATILKVELPEH
jgi:hypothetical protein